MGHHDHLGVAPTPPPAADPAPTAARDHPAQEHQTDRAATATTGGLTDMAGAAADARAARIRHHLTARDAYRRALINAASLHARRDGWEQTWAQLLAARQAAHTAPAKPQPPQEQQEGET